MITRTCRTHSHHYLPERFHWVTGLLPSGGAFCLWGRLYHSESEKFICEAFVRAAIMLDIRMTGFHVPALANSDKAARQGEASVPEPSPNIGVSEAMAFDNMHIVMRGGTKRLQ